MTNDFTKHWMRDASDELAVSKGCKFNALRGAYAVWWIERNCVLYEGDYAGTPLILRGRHDEEVGQWGVPEFFDTENALARHEHYVDGVARGVHTDWQYECIMRLFGWVTLTEWRGSEQWVRRFRRASWWVPKKNKKSPTLAAIGLYLTCGDGEPGQKVALCAKDGSQARDIAGQHILQMVSQSSELQAECNINLNEMKLTHIPSASIMKPFSSSNARSQQSKEGFNGSVLVDETHVVDRAFMRRMKRAGISRKEPIQLEVSTAGTDPDGYGKEQFDYGAAVQKGDVEDYQFMYQAYAADPSIKFSDLNADNICDIGRKINPAWGHTIHEAEFVNDWTTSGRKIGEQLDFLMYRLNLWQESSSPWLPSGTWKQNLDEELTWESLKDRHCVVGFDKSDKRDFSAFICMFPTYDKHGISELVLWPFVIAPEAYIEKNSDLAPFADWQKSGDLIVSPGEVISVGTLYDTFGTIDAHCNVDYLAYDPHKAESVTQIIEQGASSIDGGELSKGFGVERVSVNQGTALFEPITEFEALAIENKIKHPGNKVFDWMMGNIHVKETSGKKRLLKADEGQARVRKIDGPVAAVTGLALLIDNEYRPQQSIYETRGLLTL
jgi:phage terminase large subunit-like protein